MNPQSNYIPALSQTPSTTASDNNSKIPFRFAATPHELFQKGLDLNAVGVYNLIGSALNLRSAAPLVPERTPDQNDYQYIDTFSKQIAVICLRGSGSGG